MNAGVPAEAITLGAGAIYPPTRYGRDEQHCRITAARVLEAAAPAIAADALMPVYDWLVGIGFPFDFHFTDTRPAWMDLRELAEAWHRSDPSDDVETWLHGICMETEWMAAS